MNKILKSSSAHHLSQNNWRLLRKFIGRYLWKNLYTFSQKLKLPKMIKKLENSNLSLKNNLNYPQFTENKSFRKNSKFSDLISKYNTSKPEGEYRNFLDNLFFKIRPKTKTILEIGVSEGGGLLAMRDFFEQSLLWGVDIDRDTFINSERIKECEWVDQLKLKTMIKNAEYFSTKFDLIVDDGWHHPESQINSLIAYLPYLNKGGTYILEDIVHDKYYNYFLKVMKLLEKKNFQYNYYNFNMNGKSEISDNLGYLIIKRN